jgi:tetratricopeptide (TPR) repeat protein
VEDHAEALVDLYEGIYDGLLGLDADAAAEVMSRVAAVHQATEDYQLAFVALGRALSSNPEREDFYIRLESLAERLGVLQDLCAIYEDEFDRVLGEGHRERISRRLADLYTRLGDTDGMRRAWQGVVDATPTDVEALSRLADLHELVDEIPEQLEVLERLSAELVGPEKVTALLQIARIRSEGAVDPDSPAVAVMDVDAAAGALEEGLTLAEFGSVSAEAVLGAIHGLIPMVSKSLAFQLAELAEHFFLRHDAPERVVETYEDMLRFQLREPEEARQAAGVLMRMGDLLADLSDRDQEAFDLFSRALSTDPECDDAFLRMSELASSDLRWEAVAQMGEDALRSGAVMEEDEWHRRLAEVYSQRLNRPDEAYPHFLSLYRSRSSDSDARSFLETYYDDNEAWDELVDLLEDWADVEDNVGLRRVMLTRASGIALEHMGDERRGAEYLKAAAALDPSDLGLLDRVTALYMALGDPHEVVEILVRQEELAPDEETKLAIAERRAEALRDDPAEGIDALMHLRELLPDDLEVQIRLAQAYEAVGRPLEAYGLYKSVVEANHEVMDDAVVHSLLEKLAGWAEVELRSPEEATTWYRLRLVRDAQDLDAIVNLERLFEEIGDLRSLFEVVGLHASRMSADGNETAAGVLRENQAELAGHIGDDDLERSALIATVGLGHELTPGKLERLAQLAVQTELWDVALDANERFLGAVDAGEDHVEVLHEMARIAGHLGDEDVVTNYYERAAESCPQSHEALSALANQYGARAAPRKRAATLRRILDLDGGVSPEAQVEHCRELADMLAREDGEPRQAAGLLERALGTIEQYGEVIDVELQDVVRRKAANLYKRLDEPMLAIDHLRALRESFHARAVRGTALARLAEELARLSVSLGQTEDAQRLFMEAIEEDDDAVSARLGLAEIFAETADWDSAMGMLQFLLDGIDGVDSQGDKAQVYALMGRVFAATDKGKKAKKSFETALSYDPNNAIARAEVGS